MRDVLLSGDGTAERTRAVQISALRLPEGSVYHGPHRVGCPSAPESYRGDAHRRAPKPTATELTIRRQAAEIRVLGVGKNCRLRKNRTDRQNEVWAGKPVNMASKLCNLCPAGSIFVSDRYFELLSDEKVLKTCGCGSEGKKVDLWTKHEVSEDSRFDFSAYYRLESKWCESHGAEYCEAIVALDPG